MPSSVIQALSPLTIQKIAAGEVTERPANVVKELVENALDAGATKIAVALEDGGKDLIRVADNGFGMTREDARLCWLPHTTSKIRAVEDLDNVSSFGFRGEALASMASVSELTLDTRHWEAETGARLRVFESRLEEEAEIARGQGTTVTLRNLFRNNPVRRKFLGSARTETGRITTMLTRLSLAHPGVSFRLSEGAREILHLPEGTLRRRAGDVLGVHLLEDLVEVDWEGGGIHVQGYLSAPQRFSGRPGQQFFFVNRRHVQHPLLARALARAYDSLPPGRHPVGALFLSLSPAEVDVNVHPTKREVRFLNEARVFWALSQALRSALRQALDAPELDFPEPPPFSAPDAGAPPPPAGSSPEDAVAGSGSAGGFQYRPEASAARISPDAERPSPPALFPQAPRTTSAPAEFTGAPCLQIHGSFLLVAVRGGFLLVNQRAAHERILYEKALEDLRRPDRFNAQQLLFPGLVELSAPEARALERHLAELRALGFDLEPFGQTAFQLRGLPAEVPAEKAEAVLQGVVGRLLDGEGARGEGPVLRQAQEPAARPLDKSGGGEAQMPEPEEIHKRVARAYARAAAIPLGEPLDAARMAALVDGLFATQNPYVAPGGLPVLLRYSLEEIRRRFGLRGDSVEE